MPVPLVVLAVKKADMVKGLVDKVGNFIAGITCQLKGSCSPKFQAAINATGGAVGYKRVRMENGKRLEWYFLNTTEFLSWDNAAPNSMQTWYKAFYWQKLHDAGLDKCCLKQTYPPAEAFPDKGEFAGITVLTVDGIKVEVDKASYDPAVHKFETLSSGAVVNPQNVKEVSTVADGGTSPVWWILGGLALFAVAKKNRIF